MKPKYLVPVRFYGSKAPELKWLLPLLPECHHYIEPFGGSGVVLMNRLPSPLETYNDLDSEVVNFFRMLRMHPDKLRVQLQQTPYSREEFAASLNIPEGASNLEKARLWFVRMRQAFVAADALTKSSEWFYAVSEIRKGVARAAAEWRLAIATLPQVAMRWLTVQIEQKDALKLIPKFDSNESLFYCDPTYFPDAYPLKGMYKHEMDEQQHRELAEILNSLEAKVAISGYTSELGNELYGDWQKHFAPTRQTSPLASWKQSKREVLWTNYDARKAKRQGHRRRTSF